MVEHPLEHPRVAVQRHRLVRVGEVAVVAVGAHRHARGDRRVELRRIEAPLLARVVAEELLVQLAPDLADDHVFGRPDLRRAARRPTRRTPRARTTCRFSAVELVDGVEVDRDRQQLPVDARQHAVLVRPPLGELREVVEDVARVGVEDVRPVLVDQDARFVVVVVGVAADVRPLVDRSAPSCRRAPRAARRATRRRSRRRRPGSRTCDVPPDRRVGAAAARSRRRRRRRPSARSLRRRRRSARACCVQVRSHDMSRRNASARAPRVAGVLGERRARQPRRTRRRVVGDPRPGPARRTAGRRRGSRSTRPACRPPGTPASWSG